MALGLVWWLYIAYRGAMDWPRWLRSVLASLRWVALILLVGLLLKPFLMRWINEFEKPILAVYEDASDSFSETDRSTLKSSLEGRLNELDEKYDIRWMHFAEGVEDSAASGELSPLYSDLGTIKDHLANRFYNQNIGAVVIATDGIQNKGIDPRYVDDGHSSPYFFLALGDSSLKPDAGIIEVLNNKLVFLNNTFQVKTRIAIDQLEGEVARVTIERDGEPIEERTIEVKSDHWVEELRFDITASDAGLNRYSIRIDPMEGELNLENNAASFFIDVLDNRIRVHIIASVPHPDAGALKRAVEKNEQYEVSASTAADWAFPEDGLDLAVLHGFPSSSVDQSVLQRLNAEKVPIWFVVSAKSNLNQLSRQLEGFSLRGARGRMDLAGGLMASGFNLFNASGFESMNRLPPLNVPFGELTLGFQHQVLMHQRIGTVETERPLWVFYENNGRKGSLLMAEGLWKWRMSNYQLKGDSKWFDELVSKTVQYLSVRQKRTRLQLKVPQRIAERSGVEASAELYNESFELTNEPEVSFDLINEKEERFSYTFKPDANGYALSIGNLEPGTYKWQAEASMNDEVFSESGELIVSEIKAEQSVTRANHDFLRRWASREEGTVYYRDNASTMADALLNLEQAKPQVISEKQWTEIIEWKWLMALIALLVSIEWFLRKYHGSY